MAVGDLFRAQNCTLVEDSGIRQTDVVGPEFMWSGADRDAKPHEHFSDGKRIGIAGTRHDPRRSVLGDRQEAQPSSMWAPYQAVAAAWLT